MRTSASVSGSRDPARQVGPGDPRPLQAIEEAVAIDGVDDVAHLAEPIDQAVERGDDGVAVLVADVEPDVGMAAGDAGHVAEPAGGEAQQGGVLVGAVGGEAHQARRGEVRHVADDGDHLVVALRGHRHHLGAEGRRSAAATAAIVVCDVAAVGREHPHRAAEHVGVGAVETLELAAGHRVAADEAGDRRRRRTALP